MLHTAQHSPPILHNRLAHTSFKMSPYSARGVGNNSIQCTSCLELVDTFYYLGDMQSVDGDAVGLVEITGYIWRSLLL